MFLVGRSHRELLIGGPATTTRRRDWRSLPRPGQILVSPDTARLLPRSCRGARSGAGILLAAVPCPVRVVAAGRAADADGRGDRRAACRTRSARICSEGIAAPEHRTATVAFLQFGGLDEVIADEGPSTRRRPLDEVVRLVQDAAERYEVGFLDSDIASDGARSG